MYSDDAGDVARRMRVDVSAATGEGSAWRGWCMPLPGFQRVPAAITDLQAALDAAIAARDRLERAVKVRSGDDPRLLGFGSWRERRGPGVADRTT